MRKVKARVHVISDHVYLTYLETAKLHDLYVVDADVFQIDAGAGQPVMVQKVVATNHPQICLHRLSQSFVDKVMKVADTNNSISDVLFEMTEDGQVKVTKQGVIPVHRVKSLWTKDEVPRELLLAWEAGVNFEAGVTDIDINAYVSNVLNLDT